MTIVDDDQGEEIQHSYDKTSATGGGKKDEDNILRREDYIVSEYS